MSTIRPLRVAVVGAGPAGIYAADILSKQPLNVSIDIVEHLPAPFGLVRYGVAPDHPRIKQIILALHKILEHGDVRLLANVRYGRDITLDDMHRFYDAVIFATGTIKDAPMPLPGVDLEGSYGAADFVSWYDGHPDVPRTWPLEAQEIAVLGAGNVALDVARILAKHADDLLRTEIPNNVYEGLKENPVTDVHIFARRGPAQVKFSPLELRELAQVPDVDIVVYPEDYEFDDGSLAAIEKTNQTKQVVKTLTDWTLIDPATQQASRRIHLHFLHAPSAILGDGKVEALRTERTRLVGDGSVEGTGEFTEWPCQAVYRAVGYFGSPLEQVPFDDARGVIPNHEGRVIDGDGRIVHGVYATGWIKRGPVGLIGSTKSDAQETVRCLMEDVSGVGIGEDPRGGDLDGGRTAPDGNAESVLEFLAAKGVEYVQWAQFEVLDRYEQMLGASQGRERVKVVPREEMLAISMAPPPSVG
ncbi:MAG: FAD-dependent oxidoreductase [Cellulomonadaceae bacterium]|nr:FAD-dependent oxidoreductase [Cellulomonadaceae bacterium]